MRKIGQKMLQFFKNLSVLQKMTFSLAVCVIIPIVLLGVAATMQMLHLSEQNQYAGQINQIIKSAKDLENIYAMTEQSAAALANERSIQSMIKGEASMMDYLYAAQKMKDASEGIDGCSSIAVSKNGCVLFQRGERYLYENEGIPFGEEIKATKSPAFWIEERPVTFQRGINISKRAQISYYATVIEGIKGIGMLSVYLDTEEIFEKMMPYLYDSQEAQVVIDTAVVNRNGMTIFQKNPGNQETLQAWENLDQTVKRKEYGYFVTGAGRESYIVLFARCGNSGWYLLQTEKKISFHGAQALFVLCVVLLCVLFGVVYGLIQHKTIIKPLQHLSKRMDVVKSGVMEKKIYETAHDEIGNVEKGFEDMVDQIQTLINEVYVQTIKTKDAEREMLLTKMSPHFLYNALDSIHWLAFRNRDYEVSEQLEALADVYRHILQFGVGKISLEKEKEFIENYIFLLECQIGEKVEFVLDFPEELMRYEIPKLMIQPLVENSVNHGLRNVKKGGKVRIRIRKKQDDLVISVVDNGVGCNPKRIRQLLDENESQEAFALRNIHERLRLRFGDDYGLKIFSKEGVGCKVQLKVRVQEGKNEADGGR